MKVPFIPKETVSLSVTTSSANVSLGAYAGVGSKNPQIRIYNSGSVTACIKFGVAAAIAAAWYKANGGKICARPGVALFFHEGSRGTNPNYNYLHYNVATGYYSPKDFGIPTCKGK